MSFYGADVAALRGLADTFQGESAKLEATTSALRAAVTSTPWAGPDAEALRARWHGEMEAALRAASTLLRTCSSPATSAGSAATASI